MRTKCIQIKHTGESTKYTKVDLPKDSYLLGLSFIPGATLGNQFKAGCELVPLGVVPTAMEEVMFPSWFYLDALGGMFQSTILSGNGVPINSDHELYIYSYAQASATLYCTIYYQ